MADNTRSGMIFDSAYMLDPLADSEESQSKNRARVGSARPSSLLYTYGVGSIIDLPHFSVMPAGLDDWEKIWARRENIPTIDEPRLLKAIQLHVGPQVKELRPFPWQPKSRSYSKEGSDLGVPTRVFPQWFRCTGCDYLGPLPRFHYTNEHPFRPDLACFEHVGCPGRSKKSKNRRAIAVPARFLLACQNGHLDEFPYQLWVHQGETCTHASHPDLKLTDSNIGQGVGAVVVCQQCSKRRRMSEAQGKIGKQKLPLCRGRHPHLNAFDPACQLETNLIMMGASNLWFTSTQSIIVMPRNEHDAEITNIVKILRDAISPEKLEKYSDSPEIVKDFIGENRNLDHVNTQTMATAIAEALSPPPSEEERQEELRRWDPINLRVPEWEYLQKPSLFPLQENINGLTVTEQERGTQLPKSISSVIAVNRMKKINAFLGFTRIDEIDRIDDVSTRLVKITRAPSPTWVPATEDHGEGVFLQLDNDAVTEWENRIENTKVWEKHRKSHSRNFHRRFSETAKKVDPDTRFPPPRFWLLHTFAHILIREMAMYCGYGAASLSERLYAWNRTADRPAAAGLLICTTASDSEGTLGGLVALSEPKRLENLVILALRKATRCSSDPVCAQRTPSLSEDFLHGAACHCCCFVSETSCERSNRFLDRRFLLDFPDNGNDGEHIPGFFGTIDVR